MKRNILALLAIIVVAGLASCGVSKSSQSDRTKANSHNSQNSLNWEGVYKGVLPCADCEGIATTIKLDSDNNYRIKTKYLGTKAKKNVFESSGKFTWGKNGSFVTLGNGNKYQVAENKLIQLDRSGNKITGSLASHYILGKMNGKIIETYWKLISLNRQTIKLDKTFKRAPHFILKKKDNRIFGNGGCNHIMGSYTLGANDKISFSKLASTLMACPNLKLEDEFKKALEKTDHYSLMDGELTLLQGTTSLAKFKAVYF